MIGAAKRYRELLVELVFGRLVAGGTLAPEIESRLVGALDRCWREMSEAEQDEAERLYARGSQVVAPEVLAIEDMEVALGAHVAPRRAA
jgi:hypothetical protein